MQEEVSQDFFQRSAQHKKIIDDLDVLFEMLRLKQATVLILEKMYQKINLFYHLFKKQVELNNKQSSLQDFVSQNRGAEDLMHQTNSKNNMRKRILKILNSIENLRQSIGYSIKVYFRRVGYKLKRSSLKRCKSYLNVLIKDMEIIHQQQFQQKVFLLLRISNNLQQQRQKLVKIKQAVQDQYNEEINPKHPCMRKERLNWRRNIQSSSNKQQTICFQLSQFNLS